MPSPHLLFYSYSSKDEPYRAELEKHLTMLRREAVIEPWGFRKIHAGSECGRVIDEKLNTARIILLLISADFLSSEYCWSIEMSRALDRHDRGEARVIPIILRDCDWHTAALSKLQALPTDAKPVSRYRPRDAGWTDVAKGIRQIAGDMASVAPASGSTIVASVSLPDALQQVKQLAAIFVEKSLKDRQVAASKVYTLATDLSTEDAIRLAASPTFGERVAAGIILRHDIERGVDLDETRNVIRVVLQGMRDDHPRVRYRFVRAALAGPDIVAATRKALEDIAEHDPDPNVQKEAARVLTLSSKAG
jgi:hypothetical protein